MWTQSSCKLRVIIYSTLSLSVWNCAACWKRAVRGGCSRKRVQCNVTQRYCVSKVKKEVTHDTCNKLEKAREKNDMKEQTTNGRRTNPIEADFKALGRRVIWGMRHVARRLDRPARVQTARLAVEQKQVKVITAHSLRCLQWTKVSFTCHCNCGCICSFIAKTVGS